MTSNQLTYWRQEEEKRSNLAKEAETKRSNLAKETETARSNLAKESETKRSNLRQEELKSVANQLEAKGLELKRAEDLGKLMQLYAEYGNYGLSQVPYEAQQEIASILGSSASNYTAPEGLEPGTYRWVASIWDEFKRTISTLGGGKGIAALF